LFVTFEVILALTIGAASALALRHFQYIREARKQLEENGLLLDRLEFMAEKYRHGEYDDRLSLETMLRQVEEINDGEESRVIPGNCQSRLDSVRFNIRVGDQRYATRPGFCGCGHPWDAHIGRDDNRYACIEWGCDCRGVTIGDVPPMRAKPSAPSPNGDGESQSGHPQ
jgi:hypothetical protein